MSSTRVRNHAQELGKRGAPAGDIARGGHALTRRSSRQYLLPAPGDDSSHASKTRMGGEDGALSLPCLLLLAILVATALGIWGLQWSWRKQVELQARLDHCVESKALILARTLNRLNSIGKQMKVIRTAMLAPLAPAATATLRAALQGENLRQEAEATLWLGHQSAWVLRRGCDGKSDLPLSFPSLPIERQAPDALGPRPFEINDQAQLVLGLKRSPRQSWAQVENRKDGDGTQTTLWSGRWIEGPGFP